MVREHTLEGQSLIEFWLRVFRGEEPGSSGAKGLRWRAWASQRLVERGYGKAPIVVESSHEEIQTHRAMAILTQLKPETLEEIIRASEQLPAPAARSALTAESEIGREL